MSGSRPGLKDKRGYKLRDGDQVPTRLTTLAEIMRCPQFAMGVADARAGRGFRPEYDFGFWSNNDRWSYERGRQWATVAPPHIPLFVDGKITRAAKHYAEEFL